MTPTSGATDSAGLLRQCPSHTKSVSATRILGYALPSLREAVSITDTRDTILYVNPSFLRLYGYQEDELLGNSIQMVRSDRNPEELVRSILPATLHGGWEGYLWNRRKDGTDFQVCLRTASVKDEGGKTLGLIGMAFDTTEEARLRDLLRRSQEMFSKAFDCSPVIGAILSLDQGRYIQVNRAFEERIGYSREEALGKTPFELGISHDPREIASLASLLQREGSIQNRETELRTNSGEKMTGLLSAESVDISGVPCVIVTTQDITERKRAEAALKDQQEQLLALSRAAQDAIVMMDEEGRVTFWGGAAQKMFGHLESEAMGQEVHQLMALEPNVEQSRRAVQSWRHSGQGRALGRIVELEAVRKDGSLIPVELSLSSTNIAGKRHAVGIIRDVTERKRVEEEARRANRELSALVETLQLRDRRIRVMSEMQEFLHACLTTDEIGPVVARSFTIVFPEVQGALYLMSPSRAELETAITWGGFPNIPDSQLFSPDDCWGLRRGRAFWMDDPLDGLVCAHLRPLRPAACACLPLIAKSEVVGLLHLSMKTGEADLQPTPMPSDLKEMSVALSEMLSLSISNVKLREILSQQSIRDPLTGLVNRRYLEETLERELLRAERLNQSVGVIMADVDHFKNYNDTHGHAAGDLVLADLAKAMKGLFRGSDVCGRYGGEEFAMFLTDTTLEDTVRRAEELCQLARCLEFSQRGTSPRSITLSCGVSAFPVHGSNLEELLQTADAALYRAKSQGRDRVVAGGPNAGEEEHSTHVEGILTP